MPVPGKRAEFEQHIRLTSGSKPLHLKASIAAKVDSNSSAIGLIYFYRHGANVLTDYFKDGRFLNNNWQKFENHIYVPANIDSVTINLRAYGTGTAWFDEVRIEQVNTDKKPSDTVIKVVNDALQFARNTYWKSDSIDWQNVKAQAMFMGAGTGDNYYPAIKALMNSLNDPHAYLRTAEQKRAEWSNAIASPDLKSDFPTSSLLDGNIGYIIVTRELLIHPDHKKKYADSLLLLIRSLDMTYELKGWIVDLRDNIGGVMDPMLAGLSPILGPGFAVGLKYVGKEKYGQIDSIPIPSDGNWISFSVTPYWTRKNIPIAILCGPTTASSGEIVLLAFKNRPGTQIFGEPTSGVPTGPIPFNLPDNGYFTVTGALWCDRTGVGYSESIQPDVLIKNPQKERQFEKDPVIKAAKEWLLNKTQSKTKNE
jgi:C-terminal processing protease CtpA/Prc